MYICAHIHIYIYIYIYISREIERENNKKTISGTRVRAHIALRAPFGMWALLMHTRTHGHQDALVPLTEIVKQHLGRYIGALMRRYIGGYIGMLRERCI